MALWILYWSKENIFGLVWFFLFSTPPPLSAGKAFNLWYNEEVRKSLFEWYYECYINRESTFHAYTEINQLPSLETDGAYCYSILIHKLLTFPLWWNLKYICWKKKKKKKEKRRQKLLIFQKHLDKESRISFAFLPKPVLYRHI